MSHKCWGSCTKLLPSRTMLCFSANCTPCTREGQRARHGAGRDAQPCTSSCSVLGRLLPAAELCFSALEWDRLCCELGKEMVCPGTAQLHLLGSHGATGMLKGPGAPWHLLVCCPCSCKWQQKRLFGREETHFNNFTLLGDKITANKLTLLPESTAWLSANSVSENVWAWIIFSSQFYRWQKL